MKRARISLLVVQLWVAVVPILTAGAASAAAPSAAARAREHFRQGVHLYRLQSFGAALAEFAKAYELAPDVRLLYNLAQVQMERLDYVAALDLFRRYLNEGKDVLTPQRRAEVEGELKALVRLVADRQVTANVAPADLLVDGVRVGALPLTRPLALSVGIHDVVVRKSGFLPAQQTITLAGNETRRLSFELIPAPMPIDRKPAPSRSRLAPAAPDRAAMWFGLAATVGLTATTAVLAVRTARLRDEFEGSLNAFPGDAGSIEAARSQVRLSAGLTDACGVAAIVAAGFSVYFALARGPPGIEEVPPKTAPLRVLVGRTGVGLSGRF